MQEESDLSGIGLKEIREIAKSKLPLEVWRHLGAAESGSTYYRNLMFFQTILLKQRVLHGCSSADTSTSLFDCDLPSPIIVDPFGAVPLIGVSAQDQILEGAAIGGNMVFISNQLHATLDDLVKGQHGPLAFQGYFYDGYEALLSRIRKAESLGFVSVGVTIDNIQGPKSGDSYVFPSYSRLGITSVTPRDIEKLRKETSLPLFVKGIMCAEDAALAVEAGADVVIISNHGGVIMDYCTSTCEVIPEIVRAVGNKAAVLVDGGFRRGTDILKALALGARGILIGRPIFWAAAAFGAKGVAHVLNLLTEELKRTMPLCGVSRISEITPDVLIRPEGASALLNLLMTRNWEES